LVVDGMSTDRTGGTVQEYSKKYPNMIKLIDNPQFNICIAINLGLKATSIEILIIFGAHAEYSRNFIKRIGAKNCRTRSAAGT
jgi:glycosyltransferase involved in cell wall biosynthesis